MRGSGRAYSGEVADRGAASLWWNPAAHIVAEMRIGFYPFYDPTWASPFYVFTVSAVAFVLGLITLQKFVYDALDR